MVSVSRQIPETKEGTHSTIPNWVTRHEDFRRRVTAEYIHLINIDSRTPSAFRKLVLVKKAMHTASKSLKLEAGNALNTTPEDRKGWMLAFIRAAERVNLRRMKECAQACPEIYEYASPHNPEARSTPGIWKLRERAIALCREEIAEI